MNNKLPPTSCGSRGGRRRGSAGCRARLCGHATLATAHVLGAERGFLGTVRFMSRRHGSSGAAKPSVPMKRPVRPTLVVWPRGRDDAPVGESPAAVEVQDVRRFDVAVQPAVLVRGGQHRYQSVDRGAQLARFPQQFLALGGGCLDPEHHEPGVVGAEVENRHGVGMILKLLADVD